MTQPQSYSTLKQLIISPAVRDQLSLLLKPQALRKGEGDFEIGREVTKLDIKMSIESFIGIEL
tara:strand:- start:69 stop:257 length:189 start_codon:yes stop_codon:yes gene_type:complete